MELLGIECQSCGTYFFTKNETGENNCPKCGVENERYIFSKKIEKIDIKLIMEIYEDIIEIFKNKNLKCSNLEVMELIEKTLLRNMED